MKPTKDSSLYKFAINFYAFLHIIILLSLHVLQQTFS